MKRTSVVDRSRNPCRDLVWTRYLYAGSMLIATVSGTTRSYFHEDHLGDTRLVTQKPHSSVVVVFATNYEPFGVQYAASGTDPSVKYTGQWSEAVGLYWDHARFYDPTLGRFVSADPVLGHLSAPQTLNRYGYAVNNPERFADPSGADIWGSITGFFGGLLRSSFSEAVGTVSGMLDFASWSLTASPAQQGAMFLTVLTNMGIGIATMGLDVIGAGFFLKGYPEIAEDFWKHAAVGEWWGAHGAYDYFSGLLGAAPSPTGERAAAGLAPLGQSVGPLVLGFGLEGIVDFPAPSDVRMVEPVPGPAGDAADYQRALLESTIGRQDGLSGIPLRGYVAEIMGGGEAGTESHALTSVALSGMSAQQGFEAAFDLEHLLEGIHTIGSAFRRSFGQGASQALQPYYVP